MEPTGFENYSTAELKDSIGRDAALAAECKAEGDTNGANAAAGTATEMMDELYRRGEL